MPRSVAPGATDQSEYFYIVQDVGGAAPGEPKTGLTHSDISAASYNRTRGARVAIGSLSTLAAANTAHTDGGFKEVDETNEPGVYRFDPPDAVYASGAAEAVIALVLSGGANAVATPVKVLLDARNRITKNVALSNFMFKMVDSTDHVTAETGLTVTATRSLDGAAFGACANSPSEVGSGWYKIDLAAADLNGDVVVLKFSASGADTTEVEAITQI